MLYEQVHLDRLIYNTQILCRKIISTSQTMSPPSIKYKMSASSQYSHQSPSSPSSCRIANLCRFQTTINHLFLHTQRFTLLDFGVQAQFLHTSVTNEPLPASAYPFQTTSYSQWQQEPSIHPMKSKQGIEKGATHNNPSVRSP